MASGRNTWWKWRLAAVLVLVLLPALALAGERSRKAAAPSPDAENVELFAAIKDGKIDVQLFPKDATECNVRIKNNTKKPLSVKLPEAFAGVPVLAQGGGLGAGGGIGGGRRGGTGGMTGGGMNQGFGGGMGGMGMGGMGMGGMGMGGMGGMGGGFFNVAPEKVGQIKVTTVCLDHGKPDPNPRVPYEIKPIEAYTTKPGVREVMTMLGNGVLDQRVAQVCAWHLNNDMNWEQLATKQLRFADGRRLPYFSSQEIRAAMQAVVVAGNIAQQRKNSPPASTASATSSVSQK